MKKPFSYASFTADKAAQRKEIKVPKEDKSGGRRPKPKKPTEEFLSDEEFDLVTKLLPKILNTPLNVGVFPGEMQERVHDDHEGTWTGWLKITMSSDGDMWVRTTAPEQTAGSLRFRGIDGGSASPRTHNALRILALAVKLDNEARPLSRKPS